jgi:hypothetical protein
MNDSQSEVLAVCEVVFREGEEAKIGTLTMFSAFHGTARSLSEYPAFAWKFLMECGKDHSRVQILFFQVRLSGI